MKQSQCILAWLIHWGQTSNGSASHSSWTLCLTILIMFVCFTSVTFCCDHACCRPARVEVIQTMLARTLFSVSYEQLMLPSGAETKPAILGMQMSCWQPLLHGTPYGWCPDLKLKFDLNPKQFAAACAQPLHQRRPAHITSHTTSCRGMVGRKRQKPGEGSGDHASTMTPYAYISTMP